MNPVNKIVLGAAALLAGCAGASGPQATSRPSPFVVGAIYPLSGPQGSGGLSEERGAMLAADYLNDHGGVDDRPIRLDVVDVPTAESVPIAMDTLQARHIQLVVGTHGSTISAVAATEARKRHMVVWETGAVGDLQMADAPTPTTATGNGYLNPSDGDGDWSTSNTGPTPVAGMGTSFFRMSPQGSSLGRAGIDFVLRRLAPDLAGHPTFRVAVAYVEDAYGESVARGVIDQTHADHVSLAGVFPYPEYGADFTRLADQIKHSGANVLYASSYLADGEALRRATIAEHVPLLASVGTSSSYCLPAFGDQLQAAAVGLFASDKAAAYAINPAGLLPEGRTTLAWAQAEWSRRYGGRMDAYATSGFANTYALFAHVLPAAKTLTRSGMAAAAVRVKLAVGSLADGSGMDFPAGGPGAGENQAAASVIWEWVAPGEEAVVWPPAFATQAVQALPIQT